ncbi:MAG: branched-chain amino acid transport system substrate-binding protein [Chloroflexota bacterium]|jgi:branched-chain amino acid transport system substrate-binding protein|nr:branched-chain amino acid transport system substrate-binding protein [Chloroflexota bacterium]
MSDQNHLAAQRGYHYRMSRRAFLISTSAAALAACAPSTSTGGNAASSAAASAGKAMKIGQLLPFTKVYAELGNSMKRSTDLYLKAKGNRLANRPVQVIYEDEANDPQVGLAKTQKFIDQDQVDVMLGVVATPIAYAIRNAVDSAKMIYIATNAGGNALTRTTNNCTPSCKSPYIFRSSFSSYQISEPIGEYMAGKKNVKEVFTFVADYGFGTESQADFNTGLTKMGGKVTGTLKAPLGSADFVPFVTQLKAQPTKDIYSFFSGADAVKYIQAWNQLGLPAAGYRMNGAGFLTEQDVLAVVKEQANGAITSLFWAVELDNPENKSFKDAYQKEYNLLPDVFAVQAWDGMRALDEALQQTGGDTSDKPKLIAALEAVKFNSPRGAFEFDKDTHNPIQDMYIREVKTVNGQAVNTISDKIGRVTDPGK